MAAVVGGCSSGITAPADLRVASDLSAAASDLASGCTLTYSGDAAATIDCRVFLCHPAGTTEYLDITGPIDNPTEANAHFNVDATYAVRSYTTADLSSFDAGIVLGGKRYSLQPTTPGATVTLTIDSVAEPTTDPCTGVAHGSAQTTLVEQIADDGGLPADGPGRLMLNAKF